MVKHGWGLPHWAADPVVWVPREFNNAADTIVNVVMNAKAPLSFKHKGVGAIIRSGYKLKIGTAGGVRGGYLEVPGWSLGLLVPPREPLGLPMGSQGGPYVET